MRTLTALCTLAAACGCPEGFEKVDGECAPAGSEGEGTAGDPLSSENFVRRFHVRVCQEFEACKDAEIDSDYVEVDCEEEVPFETGCPFDLDAATTCLDEPWECSLYGYTLVLTWDESCDRVYACE